MIVITDTRRGGAPNRCAAIARGMAGRGWESMMVSVLPRGPVLEGVAEHGIPTADLGLRSWRDVPRAVVELRRLVRRWRPDIVQTSLWHANLLGRSVVGRATPVVDTFESIDGAKRRVRVLLDRATHGLAVTHVAVSEAAAAVAAGRERVPRSRIRVIPTGVAADAWEPIGRREAVRKELDIPPDARVVVWTGRLHPVKDLEVLTKAVGSLPGWWLLMAGAGDGGIPLANWAAEAGLTARFRFAGELEDVSSVLEAGDVFALSSKWEAMPLALLEAMATGLPVVAPRVGGIPEVVTPGHDGLLVEPGDAVALSAAIAEAAARPELGAAARETARRRFSQASMLDAYEALWREVGGRATSRRSS